MNEPTKIALDLNQECYTLIYKENKSVRIKAFISFKQLKAFIRNNFEDKDETDLKPVDDELSIFYLGGTDTTYGKTNI